VIPILVCALALFIGSGTLKSPAISIEVSVNRLAFHYLYIHFIHPVVLITATCSSSSSIINVHGTYYNSLVCPVTCLCQDTDGVGVPVARQSSLIGSPSMTAALSAGVTVIVGGTMTSTVAVTETDPASLSAWQMYVPASATDTRLILKKKVSEDQGDNSGWE